jgi:glycine oxidase
MRNREEFRDSADVVVVGGGVAGLAVARELGHRGLDVVVVERGQPGEEASHAAGGMLAPQAEADRDDEFFRLQCAGRDLYPTFAQDLRDETGCDIELDRTGTLYLAFTEEDERELERRYEWQRRAGLCVERLTGEEALGLEPSLSARVRLALHFPLDWQVENRRLVIALLASSKASGVRVWANAPATALDVEAGCVVGVRVLNAYLSAPAVVMAAGAWSSRIPLVMPRGAGRPATVESAPHEHPQIEPVRGQMLCFNPRGLSLQPLRHGHVVYTRRGYVVPRRDGRILAGSTTERVGFQKTVTAGGVQTILASALEISPALAGLELSEMWAGLRPAAADEWPVIGASREVRGLFYATGHYRNGILLAPLTGRLIAGLVADRADAAGPELYGALSLPPRTLEAFSPARFSQTLVHTHGE